MAADKKLIPVFVPTLATVLGMAERNKGSPLAEHEIKSIRDKSACIMMEVADAQKMAEKRGYIDVNPDNCWADWHRLRTQMTGNGYLPKIVLCVPGGHDLRTKWEPILKTRGIEYELQPRDEKIPQSFKIGTMTRPCFGPDEVQRIEQHTTVLYALSKNFAAASAPDVALQFLNLGHELLNAGGFAIKCESSGIAHSIARWSKLYEFATSTPTARLSALFPAYVLFPIGSATEVYSCGMHLLGAADMIIALNVIPLAAGAETDRTATAMRLFHTFALYLLDECPPSAFASGHTFSMDRDSPRYRVLWEPCTGYAEDTFFFNPFGRWRFTIP